MDTNKHEFCGAFSITPAFAKIGTQMANFFYNDGAQVVSDNGEPADGATVQTAVFTAL
jgi:hypothetical protein